MSDTSMKLDTRRIVLAMTENGAGAILSSFKTDMPIFETLINRKLAVTIPNPDSLDLRSRLLAVRDQGKMKTCSDTVGTSSECVAFAFATAKEWQENKQVKEKVFFFFTKLQGWTHSVHVAPVCLFEKKQPITRWYVLRGRM